MTQHLWFRMTALLICLVAACSPDQNLGLGERSTATPAVAKTLVMITAGELPSFSEKKILPVGLTTSIRAGGDEVLNARLALLDARGLAQPFLAASLPDLDAGSWQVYPDGRMDTTYRLRPGLTWHDGQALTADDFVFAWRVYATKELGVSANGGFKYVEEVSAPDPLTVVVRWMQAFPDAVAEVAILPPLPQHILEQPFQQLAPEPFMSLPFWREEYVGSGPWRLARREPGAFFEASAFDGFVFGRPRIDRVRVVYIPDPNTSVATLLAGEAHYAIDGILYGEDGLILERAWGTTGGTVLWESISPRVMEIQSRPEFAVPTQMATDVRVRRALAFAMDRESMMGAVTAGKGLLRDVYTHPDSDYYDVVRQAVTITYRYDPRRAEQLLREAGFAPGGDGFWATPEGGRFTLEQWYLPSSNNERESQILVDGYRQFGIDASSHVFGVQRTSVEDRVKTSGFFGGTKADPIYSSREIARQENRWTGVNRFGFANAELDRFLDAYNVTLDRTERIRLRAQMERVAMEELPAIPLYWNPRVIPYVAGLKNVGRRLVETAGVERAMWEWEWQS